MQDEENAQAAWQWEHDAFGQLVRAGVGANILPSFCIRISHGLLY